MVLALDKKTLESGGGTERLLRMNATLPEKFRESGENPARFRQNAIRSRP
jgi:hypothetical protein